MAVAGTEVRVGSELGQERVMVPVVLAYPVSELTISPSGAELFDPRVLIRRNRLGCELAAKPVGGLREDDAASQGKSAESGRASACAPADDQDIGLLLMHKKSLR
jgi:hypothetical protein